MSVETEGNALANEVISELEKVSIIPAENMMVDTFFYEYAYPRLVGIEDDSVFKANYAKKFGMNKPVQLYDEAGSKTDVVPPYLNDGIIQTDVNLNKLTFDYKMANSRSPGLGDKTVSLALDDMDIEITPSSKVDPWLHIHEEYIKRHSEIRPQVNEDIDNSVEMDW